MGSDNVCVVSFCLRKLNVCLEAGWDFAHGCWDDILNGFKDSGMMDHLMLSLLRVNIPVGPWEEDARFKQVRHSLEELFATEVPLQNEIFKHLLPDMLEEPAGKDARDAGVRLLCLHSCLALAAEPTNPTIAGHDLICLSVACAVAACVIGSA